MAMMYGSVTTCSLHMINDKGRSRSIFVVTLTAFSNKLKVVRLEEEGTRRCERRISHKRQRKWNTSKALGRLTREKDEALLNLLQLKGQKETTHSSSSSNSQATVIKTSWENEFSKQRKRYVDYYFWFYVCIYCAWENKHTNFIFLRI